MYSMCKIMLSFSCSDSSNSLTTACTTCKRPFMEDSLEDLKKRKLLLEIKILENQLRKENNEE